MNHQIHWPQSLLLALSLGAVLLAGACGEKKKSAEGDKLDGAAVFASACARCHGPNGVPEPTRAARLGVRDLTSPELQTSLSDDQIRERILAGSANGRMPAFRNRLDDDQVDALVKHVRSLAAH